MTIYDVAIAGGGFSGLCAAVMLGRAGIKNVAIIDANKRIGKKILATGNGQGNLTNEDLAISHYHGDAEFAKAVLSRFNRKNLLNFFGEIGLITSAKDGKIYPSNYCASSILDVLRFAVEDNRTDVFTETKIVKAEKENGVFRLSASDGREFFAKNVVFAFGGSSGDGFSTDGSSFALAKSFGHTITDLAPSLVQIATEREKIRGLKGIKLQGAVTLFDGGKKIAAFSGDVLFTDYGISGNCVFALSAYLKGLKKPSVSIEFLPDKTAEEIKANFENKRKIAYLSSCERLLVSVLPSRLALSVLSAAGLNPGSASDEKAICAITKTLKNFTLKVEGTAGFKASQVTAGGVNCPEVNPENMESRLRKNLFIIGEALDVDGDCGGYNLQWAYSSAAACAQYLARAIKNADGGQPLRRNGKAAEKVTEKNEKNR